MSSEHPPIPPEKPIAELLRELEEAMLALQRLSYDKDVEFRQAVDNAVAPWAAIAKEGK